MLIKFSQLDRIDFSTWGVVPDGPIGDAICNEFTMAIREQLEAEEGVELDFERDGKLKLRLPFGDEDGPIVAEVSFSELVADFIDVVKDDDPKEPLANLKAELLKALQQIEAASKA